MIGKAVSHLRIVDVSEVKKNGEVVQAQLGFDTLFVDYLLVVDKAEVFLTGLLGHTLVALARVELNLLFH